MFVIVIIIIDDDDGGDDDDDDYCYYYYYSYYYYYYSYYHYHFYYYCYYYHYHYYILLPLLLSILSLLLFLVSLLMLILILMMDDCAEHPNPRTVDARRMASKSPPRRKNGFRGSRRRPGTAGDGAFPYVSIIFHPFSYRSWDSCSVHIYIYTKENNIDIIYIYIHRVYAMLSTTPSFPRDFRYSIHVPSPSDALAWRSGGAPGANDWCLGHAHAKPKPGTWC